MAGRSANCSKIANDHEYLDGRERYGESPKDKTILMEDYDTCCCRGARYSAR